MEICILILLYYLSQNPDFEENVKPIMAKLKNSEKLLSFLNDLSLFTQAFSGCSPKNANPPPDKHAEAPCQKAQEKHQKNSQSPTTGIANEFIEQILESYLQKQG